MGLEGLVCPMNLATSSSGAADFRYARVPLRHRSVRRCHPLSPGLGKIQRPEVIHDRVQGSVKARLPSRC
jgi:hypothetical protein